MNKIHQRSAYNLMRVFSKEHKQTNLSWISKPKNIAPSTHAYNIITPLSLSPLRFRAACQIKFAAAERQTRLHLIFGLIFYSRRPIHIYIEARSCRYRTSISN